jgi:hypothetical protein
MADPLIYSTKLSVIASTAKQPAPINACTAIMNLLFISNSRFA